MSIIKSFFPFAAHYLTFNYRIDFLRELPVAQVSIWSSEIKSEYKVVFPEIPIGHLTPKKTVRWLLKNGFVPVLSKKEITFIASQESASVDFFLAECEKAIQHLQARIFEDEEHSKNLTCPLTFCLFEEPVMDNCGHNFEKNALETHLKTDKLCPLSRQPITAYHPNRAIKEFAEDIRQKCPVPPLGKEMKDLKKAQTFLDMGKKLAEAGEYQEALRLFIKAMEFTNRSEDYAVIPLLFEQQKESLKAALAYLYLARCEVQEGKPSVEKSLQKAIELSTGLPVEVKIQAAQAALLRVQGEKGKASSLYQELSRKAKEESEAILYLEQAILCNPDSLLLYEILGNLYKGEKKIYPYLMGFLRCSSTNPLKAQEFYDKARAVATPSTTPFLCCSLLSSKKTKDRLVTYRAFATFFEQQKDSSNAIYYLRKARQEGGEDRDFRLYLNALLQAKEIEKAKVVYVDWIDLLIKKREFEVAEKVAEDGIRQVGECFPLLEKVFAIYSETNNLDRLRSVIGDLGKVYESQNKEAEAEKIYTVAYQKFKDFESGFKLANTLQKQDKLSDSVHLYYDLSEQAYLAEELDRVRKCLEKIKQIDPLYNFFEKSQRQFLQTQHYIANTIHKLSKEIEELKGKPATPELPKPSEATPISGSRVERSRRASLVLQKRVQAHEEKVCAIEPLSLGKFATTSWDNTIKIWNTSGDCLSTIKEQFSSDAIILKYRESVFSPGFFNHWCGL